MNILTICTEYHGYKIFGLFGYLLMFIQISIPIILIIMCIIDLLKSLTSNDSNLIKDAFNKIIKRMIYGVLIFFIPLIIKFVISMMDNGSVTNECINSLFNPNQAFDSAEIIRGSYNKSGNYTSKESCERSNRVWIYTHDKNANCKSDNGCYICVEKGE